jgi:hypothetical protein
MAIPFNSKFAFKILRFFLIINLCVLPLLLVFNLSLIPSYVLIIIFEGFASMIVGCVQIISSLFSTMEVENHEYIGDGFLKHRLKPIEIEPSQRREMRTTGFTMIIIGILFISPIMLFFLLSIL